MESKASQFIAATNNLKSKKIVLYHIITPIDDEKLKEIQESGYFDRSRGALGGQSDGYYFFTTRAGAEYHVKNMRDTWEKTPNKHAYIVECETDFKDLKYPTWKLDYEAMQDFMFEMIYNVANKHDIKFGKIKISAENKKLIIYNGDKFSKISEFNANDHSGLIEQVTDYLYTSDKKFKYDYDMLLHNVFVGNGENPELCAVKTEQKLKITNITKIENETPEPPVPSNSQINKFLSRYGTRRH